MRSLAEGGATPPAQNIRTSGIRERIAEAIGPERDVTEGGGNEIGRIPCARTKIKERAKIWKNVW
jgi:hypothetical protein